MAKILLSWMATVHDFTKETGTVNQQGPNCLVHQYFYDYDYHVLLTTAKTTSEDTKYQLLVNYLRATFKHNIVEIAMNIKGNELIQPELISNIVNEMLITRFKNEEIEVFLSPGTPAMQFAWYLAHMSLGLNMRLFQTIKPIDSKSIQGEQVWVRNEQLTYIASLILKEKVTIEAVSNEDIKVVNTIKPIYNRAGQIALADVSVLITGSTGTGKELLAEYIHTSSHRKRKMFVSINCAAFRDDLLESRLFGYIKGAFTGAESNKEGLFHEAEGGTIFLDEIGDISPYMQQTLLRALSKGEIMRVGANKIEKINVRIIAATNKDIYTMSTQEKFRADLYYRLSTCELHLPSLSEYELKDKDAMFQFLWHKAKQKFNNVSEPKLSASLKKKLVSFHYPGNIREMENIIYGIWAEYDPNLKQILLPRRLEHPQKELSLKLADIVENHVRRVYANCNCNIKQTAEILDIQPNTVRKRLGLT